MPCLMPVLCVPDPMTPAAVTSDTAPRLGSAGGGKGTHKGPVRLPGDGRLPGGRGGPSEENSRFISSQLNTT